MVYNLLSHKKVELKVVFKEKRGGLGCWLSLVSRPQAPPMSRLFSPLNQYKKMDSLTSHSTYSKKKCFHLKEESICAFYDLKSAKCKQPLNTSFFYQQILDFHRPFKILCRTSGRQNHWSLLFIAETEIDCIEDDDKTIKKTQIDRHGSRPIPNVPPYCTPYISLYTTFNFLGNSRRKLYLL